MFVRKKRQIFDVVYMQTCRVHQGHLQGFTMRAAFGRYKEERSWGWKLMGG